MRAVYVLLLAILAVAAAWSQQALKNAAGKNAATASQSQVERGRYIVESVAMCEQCHTERNERGEPDRAHWLMGGSINYLPSYSDPNWAQREPRIAGRPPGTDEEVIRLLTTGISRSGQPPKLPMPPFRMTQQDAEAVLAYLKSL